MMNIASLLKVVGLCVVFMTGPWSRNVHGQSHPGPGEESDCFETNVAYLGDNINACGLMANSTEECQAACWEESGCIYFTFVSVTFTREPARIGECCFKNSMGARNEEEYFATGLISGPAACLSLVPNTLSGLSIQSEDNPYDNRFPASNALHLVAEDNETGGRRIYWLLPNGVTDAGFVIDMGSEQRVSVVKLWNTHNDAINDRGTRGFEVNLSTPDGSWTPAVAGNLSDARYEDAVHPEVFVAGSGHGRYLQFLAKSYYGLGAGLQYIEIITGGCETITNLYDCTTKRARQNCKWFGPTDYGYDGCRDNKETKTREHCFYKDTIDWQGCCVTDKRAPREHFVSELHGRGSCMCSHGGGYGCAWEA